MDGAARDRVADPKEPVRSVLAHDLFLRATCDECVEIELTTVARPLAQLEVELVVRHGTMLDNDLVDDPLRCRPRVVVPEVRLEAPVGLSPNRPQAMVRRHPDAGAVERSEVSRVRRAGDLVADVPV